MEQIANQRQPFDTPNAFSTVGLREYSHFRKLTFALLNQIAGAHLEIVEGKQTNSFGPSDARISAQVIIVDASFYKDLITQGSLGAAEAYLDGKWHSPNLTTVVQVMARNIQQLDKIERKVQWLAKLKYRVQQFKNRNTEQGSKRNILAHYDIGNDLYTRFLDDSMQYSSAIYSTDVQKLSDAQQLKMETICQRLGLTASDQVIEIGSGWGGLAIYMAQHYGCQVTTTTISDAQFEYAQRKIETLGLSDKITLLKQDYRKLSGQYDKLVSIEMIEAVGHNYLPTFFAKCSSLLKPTGKMLLQSITIADSRYEQYRRSMDFIQKYIFPGGCLPSISAISHHVEQSTDLVIHQVDDIGLHYARTLNDWRLAFEQQWPALKADGYDEDFKRLWLFYFCYCEGAFLERVISTHHIVARKPAYRGPEDEAILDY